MDLIFSAAVVGLFVIAAAACWPAIYALWSRVIAADTRELNFWQLVHRRKLKLEDFAGRERDLTQAMHRCIACHEAAGCDAALAGGRMDAVDALCPNRRFMDDIATKHRRT